MADIRKLTMEDYQPLHDLTIDSFMHDDYFAELFPDEAIRAAMIEKHVMVLCKYCVEHGSSWGCWVDGRPAAVQFIVECRTDNEEEINGLFFDPAIRHGDSEKVVFREKVRERLSGGGCVQYFLMAVVERSRRRQGVGLRLIERCLNELRGEMIMTELTTPEIIRLFEKFSGKWSVERQKLSDYYIIITLLPAQ